MEADQTQQEDPFINELFGVARNNTWTFQHYIAFLEEKGKIRYLGPQGFCRYIKERTDEADAQTFMDIFLDEVKRQRQTCKNRNLKFPLVTSNDPQFQNLSLECFVIQYAKQFCEYNSFQIDQYELPKELKDPQFYEIDLLPPFEELPRKEGKTAKSKQKKLKQQKKDEPMDQYSQKMHRKQMKAKKEEMNYDQDIQDGYTPPFFFMKKQAVSTLLGLNVTKVFQKELKTAKQMLKLKFLKGFPLSNYANFLQEFVSFYHIKTGLCDPNEVKFRKAEDQIIQQLKDYQNETLARYNGTIRYCRGRKQSPLIVYWREIRSNLKILLESQKNQWKQLTEKALTKGLESIMLAFTYSTKSYGMTFRQKIYINTNHNQNSKSIIPLHEYKKSCFLPYLVMTVCHQLAHFIIREINLIQFDPNEQSFNLDNQSIGCYIINLVCKSSIELTSEFAMTPKLKLTPRQPDYYDKLFSTLNRQIINATLQHPQIVQKLKDHQSNIKQLILLAQNIDTGFKWVLAVIQKTKIKEHWKSITKHIEQLVQLEQYEKGISQQGFIPDDPLETKYQLFYQLFLAEYISSEWVESEDIDREQYNHYRQRLQKLSPTTCHINDEKWINDIIGEELDFSYQFLFQIFTKKVTLASLNSRIDQLCSTFDLDDCKKYVERMKELIFQEKHVRQMFPKLKFPEVELECLNPSNSRKLQVLIKVSFAYSTAMKMAKYSDYFSVKHELPSFFTSEARIVNESGFDMESRFFPNLQSKIYSKDYQLMSDISNAISRNEIGVEPLVQQEKEQHICVFMHKSNKTHPCIDLTNVHCDTHFVCRNYTRRRDQEDEDC